LFIALLKIELLQIWPR